MNIEIYHSSDFAGLKTADFSFYYGYEETDPITEEWLFEFKKNKTKIYSLTSSDIENQCLKKSLNTPKDYLLAGIGIWLSKSQFEINK